MPRFDGTGPQGFGARTGRGFGFCVPGARDFRSMAKWVPIGCAMWYGARRLFRRRAGFGAGGAGGVGAAVRGGAGRGVGFGWRSRFW